MVRDPIEPQVVSQSRGITDHGGHDGRAPPRLPCAVGRPRRHSAQIPCRRQGGKRRHEEGLSLRFGAPFPDTTLNDKGGWNDGPRSPPTVAPPHADRVAEAGAELLRQARSANLT